MSISINVRILLGHAVVVFFVRFVEARIRANIKTIMQREQETKGGGRGMHKIRRNRDMKRSVERRGMRWGTQGKKYGH